MAVIRVLCLVPYPTIGPSNRLRVEQYAPALAKLGIELTVAPYLDDRAYAVLYREGRAVAKAAAILRGLARRVRDVARARRYDAVLIHREAMPFGPPVIERILTRVGIPYVYDFDDALFLAPVHPVNRRWALLRHPSRYAETARLAAAVICGNEYLAEWARHHNRDVTVIPTPVDTDRHRPRPPHRDARPLVIGWVGSSTTAPYLRIIDDALGRLARTHDIVVRVMGGKYSHPVARVEVVPYRLDEEPAEISRLDIGLLPEPDDAWTRGKGALKGLLYMATAVPVVASAVGVNPDFIGDGGICVAPEGWYDAIDTLARDPDLRAQMGRAGRCRVEERFSVAVQAPRLAEVLRRVVGRAA
jgi:glycosyltransferase involved in cell wall biosynthesis